MNIRNFIKGLMIMCLAPMLWSCEDFLDRKPLTATLEDLGQGGLESQILGMYQNLRDLGGFSSLPWVDFHSVRDDDAQKGSDANDGREINTEFETFQYTKDDWAINSYWEDHYAIINAANNALDDAKQLGETPDPASLRNIGEAHFFRAYAYFELVKNFGEVPLIDFRIVNPTDGLINKSSLNELYALIDADLTIAVANLPLTATEYGIGYKGRLTNGSAKTLWAQTYLMRSDWGKLKTLCEDIVGSGQYSLAPDFSEIWMDGVAGLGKNGVESIWEVQAFAGQNANTNTSLQKGSNWGSCQSVRQNGAGPEWNLGWGWNTPTDKLVAAWPVDDPRKERTILYSGKTDGGKEKGGFGLVIPTYTNPDGTGGLAQKYWNKKIYSGNDPAMRTYTGFTNAGNASWINHRVLRYADVILMLAEAANELGDGATAAINLEKIRNRASGNKGQSRKEIPYIPFTSQTAMRQAIKDERRWEFAMEGYRFYDLVRWGDAIKELSGMGYTNRCRYYPIPQKAITLSGGTLKQNSEWL